MSGSSELYELDIWLLDHHITSIDNVAYLKSVVYQAEGDVVGAHDLYKFSKYFQNMSAKEAHKLILSTRDPESEFYDFENDEVYPNQQVLNWGPNTDNIACFLIPIDGSVYITVEHYYPPTEIGTVFSKQIDVAYFDSVLKEFIECGASKI